MGSRPEESAEMEMEEDFAPRIRLRGKNMGGSAGSKRARATRATKGASSDNEEAEEEVRTAWLADLEKRSPADLRNAFTLKPCSGKELRQLGDEAFLGGKRRPGALPIYDLEGRVSLQFLLASYKASEKSRERLRGEDSEVDLHRPFLRWHIRKARELRLLNSREVRRGTLAAGRVDVASKSGQWLLSLEQNQAEASDEEGRKKGMDRERAQAIAAASLKLDVQFPSKLPKAGSPEEGNGTALLKERLRNQLEAKKEKIDTLSSDGLDLRKMCDRLMAPSLSFDWDEPESDEEEDSSKGILQVEVPVSASDSEGRRALLREQIQRSVSFKQAKELSKVKSLPSSSSLQELRNAATPTKSKKQKTQLSNEPSASTEETKTQELLDEKEIQEPPAGATSDAVSASDQGPPSEEVSALREEDVSMDMLETDASVAVEASKDEGETLMGPGDAQEISAETAIRPEEGLPADIEISPTLRFEPEEPPPAANAAVGGLDISPTLPFDIDATALQEACRVEEPEAASEASDAVEKATEERPEVPPEEPEVEDPAVSSEDEELKGDTRALRERAWLRHKRNMQAAQLSQEDDGEVFAPVGRAPKRRAKGSILMKN